MENHNEISLSQVRELIIRYGAKYMESYESDLYYDCKSVGKMQPGDTTFWMVSGTHTHMYTAKEMHDHNIGVNLVRGNRFNYRIDCKASRYIDNGVQFDMTQVCDMEIQMAVNDYQRSLVNAGI